MHYYIDGYNLLFRMAYHHTSLQQERERIIDLISQKIHLLHLETTLVFDSAHTKGSSTTAFIKDLRIVYTDEGQSADDWIVDAVQRDDKKATVVTSDKRLAKNIIDVGGKVLSIEDFVRWIDARVKNKKEGKKKVKKELPLLPVKENTPSIISNGSYEYYLQIFEEEIKHLPPPPKQAKLKKQITKEEPQYLSENERWLKLFNDQNLQS